MTRMTLLFSLLSLGATDVALAQDHPHHTPPPEAFEACKSLAAGAACTVTHEDHTMEGTCSAGHDGSEALHCRPNHRPGPPPEQK